MKKQILLIAMAGMMLAGCTIGYPKAKLGEPNFKVGDRVEYNGKSSLGPNYAPPLAVKSLYWDYDYNQYGYITTDKNGKTWPAFFQYQLKKY